VKGGQLFVRHPLSRLYLRFFYWKNECYETPPTTSYPRDFSRNAGPCSKLRDIYCTYSTHGETRNACRILVEKREGGRVFEIILETVLRNRMEWYGPDTSGSE
jgi:hypothetical protein